MPPLPKGFPSPAWALKRALSSPRVVLRSYTYGPMAEHSCPQLGGLIAVPPPHRGALAAQCDVEGKGPSNRGRGIPAIHGER